MAFIYRAGRPSQGNLTPRPKDNARLSCRDSLSNPWPLLEKQRPVFESGESYMVIDTDLLPAGAVDFDNDPPGHVSIIGIEWDVVNEP